MSSNALTFFGSENRKRLSCTDNLWALDSFWTWKISISSHGSIKFFSKVSNLAPWSWPADSPAPDVRKWWSWTPDILFKLPGNDWPHGDFTKTMLIKMSISLWLLRKFHWKWGKKTKLIWTQALEFNPHSAPLHVCVSISFKRKRLGRWFHP